MPRLLSSIESAISDPVCLLAFMAAIHCFPPTSNTGCWNTIG